MIDSAVRSDHMSLRGTRVISEDFAPHEGSRPLGHGTAVASLITRSAANEAEIHAASVFFQAPGFAPGATTDSLIAALDWLVSQEVQVINMSLAGPANELLETALIAVADAKGVVVAAVGNNGPSGEPLYPAAYEGVIGVTAVDREQKIFRYANRGAHVDYAALGVDVKVADSDGSWRLESGTSMASPHIAVVVARMRQSQDIAIDNLMNLLAENAEDLGKKGFDRIFGHGLITEPPLLASSRN
jgi:subtilisin family serine protease